MFENFPYTNFHDLNLDWIIQKIKEAYSPDNPPEDVVLTVNGETGDVILYKEALIRLPALEDTDTWNIFRTADGVNVGIQFKKNAPLQRINGLGRYDIYDSNNPPPYPVSSVDGSTGAVKTWANSTAASLKTPAATSGNAWGVKREMAAGDAGIQFEYANSMISGFLTFDDGINTPMKVKILTPDDIPSASGVVSFNGLTGVIICTASDLKMSNTDNTTIKANIDSINSSISDINTNIAYLETGNTATRNYSVGDYLIVNKQLKKARTTISSGDTLSSSNLLDVDNLGSEVKSLSEHIANIDTITEIGLGVSGLNLYKLGKMRILRISGYAVDTSQTEIANVIPSGHRPNVLSRNVITNGNASIIGNIGIVPNGTLDFTISASGNFYGEVVYLAN